MLSAYPASKIRIGCTGCGLNVQYDREALLASGGDRLLGDLLDSIARRHGCALVDRPGVSVYHVCQARFYELPDLLRKAGQF